MIVNRGNMLAAAIANRIRRVLHEQVECVPAAPRSTLGCRNEAAAGLEAPSTRCRRDGRCHRGDEHRKETDDGWHATSAVTRPTPSRVQPLLAPALAGAGTPECNALVQPERPVVPELDLQRREAES
jgi:hypothetical protein